MTVRELIEKLQQVEPETLVVLPTEYLNQFIEVDEFGETVVAWSWGSDGHKCWVGGLLSPEYPRKAIWLA